MLEVFTVGGGEYIVNVLNAVASWSGGGRFPLYGPGRVRDGPDLLASSARL